MSQVVGYKLEAFILNHRAGEMLPDSLRHLHRFRLSDHLTLVPVNRRLLQEVVATFGEYKAEDDPYEDSLLIRLLPPLRPEATGEGDVLFERGVVFGLDAAGLLLWRHTPNPPAPPHPLENLRLTALPGYSVVLREIL